MQALLRRVQVRQREDFSARFPKEMPSRVRLELHDGRELSCELASYPGFLGEPMSWTDAREKFERLSASCAPPTLRQQIADSVAQLEEIDVARLAALLAQARVPQTTGDRPWH